ncbi:GAF domain-containing protein [Natronomonas marina]|uniref:GAF domain-containing protein n=1 Tax=Natronomonas marina TaxID=2961939 RepID=UPI0020CA12E3|nr:GAF domain-containing protein [Natronomonas marina]
MILCIDSDTNELGRTRDALEAGGFRTRGADSLEAARTELDEESVDCLVTEYDLPDGSGLELLRESRRTAPDTACVLYTDRSLEEIDTAAFGDVIAEYVPKGDPDAVDRLVDIVEHSLAFRSQTAYPLPENEDARLAALERYAEDPASLSASLGRLTELAAEQFNVDAAAVGLIASHEERFISCHGTSLDSLEREETICTYAILDEDVTVVEDTAEDPRFSDNEEVRAAGIRFYAGAPMTTTDGHRVGVFCLHHSEARSLAERDRELLSLYADEAMEQLELRHRLRDTEGGQTDG